jgi:translation initiation factor eIF-2B subunit gamma
MSLDPTQTVRTLATAETPDFSAVILVGNGDKWVLLREAKREERKLTCSLYPFNQGSNVLPKALMPVGNVPVVSIVMDWVFEAGLTGEPEDMITD